MAITEDRASLRWLELCPIVAISFLGIMPTFLLGALDPLMRSSISLTPGRLGLILGSFFVAASVGALSVGKIDSRISLRIGIVVMLSISGGAMLCIGTAGGSWQEFLLLYGAAGFCNGMIQPSINVLLSEMVNERVQGRVVGIKQSSIPFAAVVAGSGGIWFAGDLGWASVFVALGTMDVVVSVIGVTMLSRVRYTSKVVRGIGDLTAQVDGDIGDLTAKNDGARRDRLGLSGLTVAQVLGSLSTNALTGFIVVSLVAKGMSIPVAGAVLAAGSLAAGGLRIGLGWVADRINWHVRLIVVMLFVSAVGFALLGLGTLWVSVTGSCIAFCGGWSWAGLMNYTVVHDYSRVVRTAAGRIQAAASTGGIIGPVAFGVLHDATDAYSDGWMMLCFASLLGAGAVLISVKQRVMLVS